MDYRSYIKTCIEKKDEEELLLSWNYLGAKEASKLTRIYVKDSLYLINCPTSRYNGYLLWCKADYNSPIDWDTISVNGDVLPYTVIEGGVSTHCFEYLSFKTEKARLQGVLDLNPEHVPFTKYNGNTEKEESTIQLSDQDYYRITKVIGQPFITDAELEYSREAIIRLSIEPAMWEYWTHYPIEEEDVITLGGGQPYDILIPDMAFNAISWTTKGGYSGAPYTPASVLSGYVGMATTKDYGLTYNKPVPGYTGRSNGESRIANYMDNATLINTLKTLSTRERSNVVRKEDGLHLVGYSNASTVLNVVWLKWSKNYTDVAFEDRTQVMRFCQAAVKSDFGAIRSLLKNDNNIPMDAQRLITEGQQEYDAILKKWDESPWRLRYAIEKGGWMPGQGGN